MMEHTVNEVAIGREAGVINVVDVVARDNIATLVGAPLAAARLIVAAVGQQLVPDMAVSRHPHSNKALRCHCAGSF